MKIFINGKVFKDDKLLDLSVKFDKKIISFACPSENDEVIDLSGYIVSPGFIDTHIHGINSFDVMDGDENSIYEISKSLAKNGTTSFLATTMTMEKEHIRNAIKSVESSIENKNFVARPLGIHLEGPFISKEYIGAQDEKSIIVPNISMIEEFKDIIKLITYAPEEDKDNILLHWAINNNINLSIGHSNATYDKCKEVIDMGVNSVTHLFNAMRPLNHREPGVVGAGLVEDVYSEVIADDIHINPVIYKMIHKLKGDDKILLVTDSIRATCLKNGEYDLGGQTIIKDDNSVRLKSNGALAGSILTQDKALKNFVKGSFIDIEQGLKFLTSNPAKLMGNNEIGSIEIGKKADFVVLDRSFNVVMTYIDGEKVYQNENYC